MIEVYELLRTKEDDLARVRREIEALRIVTPLLLELTAEAKNESTSSSSDCR